MKDVTDLFEETKSRLIRAIVEKGGVVLGMKAKGFAGVLLDDRVFAEGLERKVIETTGLRGYVSTDELPRYGVTKADRRQIEVAFDVGEKDIVILVVGQEAKAKEALRLIEEEIAKRKS